MTCPRCGVAEITRVLAVLTLAREEGGTQWETTHSLCHACAEDVFWFVVHKTLKRPELCELPEKQ